MLLFGQHSSSRGNFMNKTEYLCPLCQQMLIYQSKHLLCKNQHNFDCAKEGYVNLLPVQYKHSKNPGDNKAMVNARRAFLDKGFYRPLVEKLTLLYQSMGDITMPVLDAGCGEGYYTHQHKKTQNKVYGVDIAKNAIRLAAKRYKTCFFSVGTLSQLPFKNEYFAWIYSIYAPILEEEFTRVLKKGGYFVTVTPAENHLLELKSLIYREVKKHNTNKKPVSQLNLVQEHRLNYTMSFQNSDDLLNLLSMTPFAFKTTTELLSELKNKKDFNCQADFLIRIYQRNS